MMSVAARPKPVATSQAYRRYIEGVGVYEEATARVERLIARLAKFVTPLQFNWGRYYVDAGGPIPAGMVQERICIGTGDVPSPGEIGKAMVAQFEALQKAADAWARMPASERDGLEPPKWLPKQRF